MNIPLDRIGAAVASGLSLVCATCAHYWRARALDPGAGGCGREGCKGPLRGGAFEEYEGPISDFTRWCLRCGGEASAAVRAVGKERAFGLCGAHKGEFLRLLPDAGDSGLVEVLQPSGLVAASSLHRRRNPVLQILDELEAERRG